MEHDAAPAGKAHKYARHEFERRFLLPSTPAADPVRTVSILDRYILDTRLRLRRIGELGDDGHQRYRYKLTQKVPAPEGGPGLITTTYLNAAEHATLSALPGVPLRKTRLSLPPLGVDLFEGELIGLVLAEAEFDDAEAMRRFPVPEFALADVTRDRRFTGGWLARCSRAQARAVAEEYGLSLN